MKLIIPNLDMKFYFMNMVNDYIDSDCVLEGRTYFEENFNFEEFINSIKENRNISSDSLDPIQQYEWWMVNENNAIVGTSRLRMVLEGGEEINEHGHIGYDISPSFRNKGNGSMILKKTLKKAKDFGFEKVFITCTESNFGSQKIIEKNGGVFHSKIFSKEYGEGLLRYWINI